MRQRMPGAAVDYEIDRSVELTRIDLCQRIHRYQDEDLIRA
jgi:hypothetical protein